MLSIRILLPYLPTHSKTSSTLSDLHCWITLWRPLKIDLTNVRRFFCKSVKKYETNWYLKLGILDKQVVRDVTQLTFEFIIQCCRLMTMSPCLRSTLLKRDFNDTVKNRAIFSSIINGIMIDLWLPISIPQFFNQIENSITFTP